MIFIDVFNLAEQFGIYFIAKENSLDETVQQRFFFILFGVGGAILFRPMLLWSKLQIIFSILVETAELICYLVLLPHTTSLIVVATIFFVIEVVLHGFLLWGSTSNLDDISSQICLRDYCCFPIRILMYGFIYSSNILFLFLDPTAKLRDTYYEVLLILNVFFGMTYIDISFAPLCAEESEPTVDETIYRIWQYTTMIIYSILAFIIMITTLVFAGQAINKHATGEEVLRQYDFGVYIYCLVNYGILACAQCMNCFSVCLRHLSKK